MANPETVRSENFAIDPAPPEFEDEKAAFEHQERLEAEARDAAEFVIMKSPFEDMNFQKTAVVFRKATLIALMAAFSAAADGYQIAMTGNIIANSGFILQYSTAVSATGAKILAAPVLAAWGGVQSAGQGFGMISMHFIADRFGRKIAFYLLWVSLLIGVCCESFGRTWQTWLVAKFFSGYGVGCVQFMTGTYITEIAPARIRGFLLIFYSIWYSLGQLFAITGLKVLKAKDPYNYLDLIYSEWAMLGIMLAIYVWIPESPWWCANHGRTEQGKAVLKRLNGGISGYDVDFHWDIIARTVSAEQKYANELRGGVEKSFWRDVYDTREIFYGVNGFRTLVAFMPAAVQQLTGLAVLSSYSSYFAQLTGFADPFTFTLLLSIVAILITILGAIIIDFIGRRQLFLGASLINWIMLLLIGGMGLLPQPASNSINQLVVFFALVWRMASTLLGDLGWSYVAETGSSRLRAKTAGFSAAGGVVFGLIFSTSVPYMLNVNYANWGLKTTFFFAGVSAPLCIGSIFIMPDTSRRTPGELDEMFEKKIRPWRFREYVTDAQKALMAEKERTGETDPAKLQHTRDAPAS